VIKVKLEAMTSKMDNGIYRIKVWTLQWCEVITQVITVSCLYLLQTFHCQGIIAKMNLPKELKLEMFCL